MKPVTTILQDIPWVSHGFFTRQGGASGGIFSSLNCGLASNDKMNDVTANRNAVAKILGLMPGNIATPYQVHSATAVMATAPWKMEEMPKADAVVTDRPGLGIGVLTADCAPVMFASRRDKIIGIAHAGWKGAIFGVLEATVAAMKEMGAKPEDITVAIGPCIGAASYEVSDDFKPPFLAQDESNIKFFGEATRPGHLMFDLPGYVTDRLQRCGIGMIVDTRQDTLANEACYFSYRRTCQRGEKDYGRQISVIAIKS